MFGNGVRIGSARTVTAIHHQEIPQVPVPALTAFSVVAAGTTALESAVCRFEAMARPTTAATASVCALLCSWLRLRFLATTKLEASFVLFVWLDKNVHTLMKVLGSCSAFAQKAAQ